MQPKGVLIGVAVVVLAVIAYLVLSGGGNDTPAATGGNVPSPASQAATAIAASAASQATITGTRSVGTVPAGATPAAVATPRATLAPLPSPIPGAANDYTATNRAHQALRSYRVTSEFVSGAGASPLRLVIEVQNPDRYHASFPTLTPGAGPAVIEVIGIGSATYVKAGPAWVQGPANAAPFQAGQILAPIGGFLASSSATRGATTTVAGASCTVWTVTTPTNQRADVCVGSDSLVRQLKYSEGSTTQTITFDLFNVNFGIVTP